MPPNADDQGIGNERFLLRALPLSKWIVDDAGRQRAASESMIDSTYENSCFIEGEITIEQVTAFLLEEARRSHDEGLLYHIERGLRFARIPVEVVRQAGFSIERRPEEARGCANPAAHVVVGPREALGKKAYTRAARSIVRDARTTIVAAPLAHRQAEP